MGFGSTVPQTRFKLTSILQAPPTGATIAGTYTQVAGAPPAGIALGDLFQWTGADAILLRTYSDAPPAIEHDTTSYIKLGASPYWSSFIVSNSANRYIDIADVRIQWGSNVGSQASDGTVTLPAAFADMNYVVTTTCTATATDVVLSVATNSQTTTQFKWAKVYGKNGTTGTAINEVFSWMGIGKKPPQTVSNSANRYVDIADVRIQWGNIVGSQTGTVTLPAAFADTSYVVTATIISGSTNATFSVGTNSQTTTQFNWAKTYGVNATTGPAGEPFSWMAIGKKPL